MAKYIATAIMAMLLLCGAAFAQDLIIKRTDTSDWPTVRVLIEAPGREIAQGFMLSLPGAGGSEDTRIAASGVSELTSGPRPASIVVALDTSRSLSPAHLQAAKSALSRYADELDKDEQVALLAFDDAVQLVSGFTSDRQAFKTDLSRLKPSGNFTELYRAMLSGLDLMKNIPGQRALLVITDGKDEGRDVTPEQVIHAARDNGIPILAIGLATLPGTESEQYLPGLQAMADATGGAFRRVGSAEELREASYELLVGERGRATRIYEAVFGIPGDIRPVSGRKLDAILSRIYGKTTQMAEIVLTVPTTIGQAAGSLPAAPIREKEEKALPPGVKTVQVSISDYLALADTESSAPPVSITRDDTEAFETEGAAPPISIAQAEREISVAEAPPVSITRDDAKPILIAAEDTSAASPQNRAYSAPTGAGQESESGVSLWWSLLVLLLFLALLWWVYRRSGLFTKNRVKDGSQPLLIEFPELNRSFPLKPGTMVLGASPDNDIVVDDDPAIGASHVEFCVGDDCKINNLLASKNLLLNGRQVQGTAALKPGDQLVLGSTRAIIRAARDSEWQTSQ